ncbi:MAG: SDR family oxidoreductase [Candidatus Shapirobacteria bacterium]|nr:SDR family oxidoreductase [Candidatus Shapirobacteria bacterium]
MKLENKVAIVTGAASGIGQAIAILYAQEGAKVVVADINLEAAQAVVSQITASGKIAVATVADVAKKKDVESLIDFTVKNYGTLDILVNNAGIMDNFVPVGELTDELWEKVFGVNINGPMYTIRKAMPIFVQNKKGVIVNIASVGGLQGSRAGAAYTASKFAIVGLTKNIGYQYAGMGIRCNAIAPGGVSTNIGKTIDNPNKFGMEKAMSGIDLNPRTGKPEEIAQIALFLAADDSSFINGTVITADAGWTAY